MWNKKNGIGKGEHLYLEVGDFLRQPFEQIGSCPQMSGQKYTIFTWQPLGPLLKV